jgi:hypothetical protein
MLTSTADSSRATTSPPAADLIRTFLLVQAATFIGAATLHFGVLIQGFADARAAVPESVIASVLLAGLIATWIRPTRARGIGLVVQGFGLAGTLVGLFIIVIGIGPRTLPDLVIHATMLAELVGGLVVAARVRINQTTPSA